MVSTEGGGWGGSLHDRTFMHLNHLLLTIKNIDFNFAKKIFYTQNSF